MCVYDQKNNCIDNNNIFANNAINKHSNTTNCINNNTNNSIIITI